MKAQHLSTQEVCLFLGISLSTFYRYCKRGLLKPSFFTSGGHRRFDLHTIKQAFNIDNSAELVVCYSRVSSHDQKKDLATQENKLLDYAQSLNLSTNKKIVSINDLGSGLNYKKKGLKQLISLILVGKVQTLILNHKDRLLRFGSEIIFSLCKHMKVNVIVLEAKKDSKSLKPTDFSGSRGCKQKGNLKNPLGRGFFKDNVLNKVVNADLNAAANHVKVAFPKISINKDLWKFCNPVKTKTTHELTQFIKRNNELNKL